MKKEDVTHRGVVQRVEGDAITVLSDEAYSCDGCAVAALCNKTKPAGDSADRTPELITVRTPDAGRFRPGERVELSATSGSTLRAVLWALVLPTVVFTGVLLWVRLCWPQTGDWSILVAFAALGLYTCGLYLCRKALAKKIVWRVRRA